MCCMLSCSFLYKKKVFFHFYAFQTTLARTEPFGSLSSPSAHFLCVTAPFPVSVEAIRKITQPPHITPFSPVVSFSIFRPARLFPPFSYLLFFLACIFQPGPRQYLILKNLCQLRRGHQMSVRQNYKESGSLSPQLLWCFCLYPTFWPTFSLHGGKMNHVTRKKTSFWCFSLTCLVFQMQNPLKCLSPWKKNGNAQVRNLRQIWPRATTLLEMGLPDPLLHPCSTQHLRKCSFGKKDCAQTHFILLYTEVQTEYWKPKSLLWGKKPCWDLWVDFVFLCLFHNCSPLLSPPLRPLSVRREGKEKNRVRNNECFLLRGDLLRRRGINAEHMWWAIVRRCVVAFPASACFL